MHDRTEVIHVRVTPREKTEIVCNADYRGLKPASYLRHLIEADTISVEKQKRREARKEERERKRLASL